MDYAAIVGPKKYNEIVSTEAKAVQLYIKEVPKGERLKHDHEILLDKRVAVSVMNTILPKIGELVIDNRNQKQHIDELTSDLKEFKIYDPEKFKKYASGGTMCVADADTKTKAVEAMSWLHSTFM